MVSIRLLIIAFVLVSFSAFAQVPVYYCLKNGKRTITDQPCENLGSIQEKKFDGRHDLATKNAVAESVTQTILCPQLQAQKQSILDAQYYKGLPASPARLNQIDALMLKHGCPWVDVTKN